ncbi:MAG: Flagellin [bacterium ADurb.Bin236]|nr:MAG: Flagellin [bacterium ADurb.Bin236]
MKIDNAIGSLNVNNLRMRFLEMKTATERLSSGLKINRAADDPSGLAIRDGMNAKARSLSTAIANVEESIRMTRIMDSSMATIGDILVQLKSLAVRASNEAVLRDDCSDRTKLNSEARALVKEIDQIAYSTLYNAKKILQGDIVEDIVADGATLQTVVATGTAHSASWAANNQILYIDEVSSDATRPGGAGTTDRAFIQTIDPATNAAIGAASQFTHDPYVLVDPDGDGYYDVGPVGVINDVLNFVGASAPNQIDADGDGWVVGIDNNDADATEVGASLSAALPIYTIASLGSVDSTDVTAVSQANTRTRTFTGGATLVQDLTVTVTAGMNYTVQVRDSGTSAWVSVFNGISAGGPATHAVGGATTYNAVRVVLDEPVNFATAITINSVNAPGPIPVALSGVVNSFVDLGPVNTNVRTFTMDTSAGAVSRSLDRISVSIKNGHQYRLQWSDDGVSWGTLTSSTGTGGLQTFSYTTDTNIDLNSNGTAFIRVVIRSGEDASTAILANPTVMNRRDRDGDGFPDVIEVTAGSNPNLVGNIPAWSLSLDPDLDADGFLDHASYDLIYNNTYSSTNNPFGAEWDGSGARLGNPLDSASGQYAGGLNIDPTQVPSNTDTDGDTIPDPLDPIPGTAEWLTWNDYGAAYKGGDMWFISNRSTPNQNIRDIYTLNGTTYTLASDSLTNDASDIAMSNGGDMVAWIENGNIYYANASTSCTGVTGAMNVNQLTFGGNNYNNPSWKYDNSQLVVDDGGSIVIIDFATGAVSSDSPGVAGTNPDWSSDGDNIVYESGGAIKVYNLVMEQEFDLGVSGTNPTWSPDGSKILFESGGSAMVVDVTITKRPSDVQANSDNIDSHKFDFSMPDARAYNLGINSLNIQSQAGALNGIDQVDAAIETLNGMRASVGQMENVMGHLLEDLRMEYINVVAARSNIEDADFARVAVDMAKAKILTDSALAVTSQMDSVRRGALDLLSQHGVNPGLKTAEELAAV